VKIGLPQMDEPLPPSPEGINYLVNVFGLPEDGVFYHCPCCLYPTLPMRGGFEVCPVCYWEDDGQDSHDADRVRGGPNEAFSLTEARANFATFGVYDAVRRSKVRSPTAEEKRYRWS
jgi:Cysteine-rich CPCC